MVQRRVRGIVYVTRSTIPVLEAMYRLRTKLLQVLAIALGITALMSLFLAATISRSGVYDLAGRRRREASTSKAVPLLLILRSHDPPTYACLPWTGCPAACAGLHHRMLG